MKFSRPFLLMLSVATLVTVALSGCDPEATPKAASAPAAVSPASNPGAKDDASLLPTEPTTEFPGIAVPGALSACDPASVVNIKWNFDQAKPALKLVDVYVGPTDAQLKLFVTGPTKSEVATGPWTRPGTIVVFKNHADSTELHRVVVKGPACG